jgi:hypothetical protein
MPQEEETRLRAAITDSHGLSLTASYALSHAGYKVANDNDAYLKLVEADAAAHKAYNEALVALQAYGAENKLI